MFPELIHGTNCNLDTFDVFDRLVDEIGITELPGVVTIVLNFILEDFELIENTAKLLDSNLYSAFILKEFSLLHHLSEMSNFFLERLDVLVVVLLLMIDEWLDLLLDILCKFLHIAPVLVDVEERFLIRLLDFFVIKHKFN